jgi:dihydrodipicolinate synthase/N-acetylneuraminate lyase
VKIQGVVTPVAVPLHKSGAVDYAGLDRMVEHLIACGVDGLFANGSMGGFAFHEDRVQAAIVERICAANRGRKPLLAGVSDTSVSRVLAKARSMAGLPVDAFVVLPPYYFIYDQPALTGFFRSVADGLPRPVVLYENPRLAHNSLTPATIAELARHPNVIGLKISTPDVGVWQELLGSGLARERFALIAGAEKMMSAAMRAGFDGMTGGFHNLFATAAVELFRAARAGDFAAADSLQEKLNRAYRVFEIAGGWRGLEIALRYMGIAEHAAPAPFDTPPGSEAHAEILEILKREGCPVPYPERSLT